MSDDDLLKTVRTQFAEVRLGAPVEHVIARGRQLRRRRRTWPAVGAGTGAVATVAAIAVGLAAPGAGPGSARVVLDAWSVVSKPGGTVSLTIRDQRESGHDRARLREALREAGVLAVVQTALPLVCQTVTIGSAIQVSRHHGTVTAVIELGKLPKRAQVTVVVPAVLAHESTSRGRTEVRIPRTSVIRLRQEVAIGRRRPSQVQLPQVVVLKSATVCERLITSKAPRR